MVISDGVRAISKIKESIEKANKIRSRPLPSDRSVSKPQNYTYSVNKKPYENVNCP